MGVHSFFFVNQLHGLNLFGTYGPVSTGVVGKDICYQCSIEGPDTYDLSGCEWRPGDDNLSLSIGSCTPSMKFHDEVRHGFMLREQAVAEKFFNPKRDFKMINNLFRPRRNLVYDDAIQHIYFIERTAQMLMRCPWLEDCIPVHHPSTYTDDIVCQIQ